MTKDAPMEILLVEDNPADARLFEIALKQAPGSSNLHVVGDGVEALAFLRRQGKHADAPRPRIVLLDLDLPLKGGFEVLAEIRSDPDLKHLPVVMLTGSATEADVLKAYSLHANCYFLKSADFQDSLISIRKFEDFWLDVAKLPKA